MPCQIGPLKFPNHRQCVCVCVFFSGDTCASDCRMKEHLVWFDPPRWGDVRSVIEDRRSVLQSNHTIRQRGRVLCLLVKGKREKKVHFELRSCSK